MKDKCSYFGCSENATINDIHIPSRFLGKGEHTWYRRGFCREHAEFVKDCIMPGVSTSEGRRDLKEIKKLFKTRNHNARVCPRCGFAA